MLHPTDTCVPARAVTSSHFHVSAHRAGRRTALRGAVGVLAACAAVAIVAGGCANPRVKVPRNEAEFRDLVASADKPVLVDFFKGGCASCMFLDPTIDQLAEEYDGRVIVARFELMRFWLEITSIPLWKEYRIGLYPTVVLLVDGKEKKRWAVDYFIGDYRKALTELVGPPAGKPAEGKGGKPAEGDRQNPEKPAPSEAGGPAKPAPARGEETAMAESARRDLPPPAGDGRHD